MPNPPSPLFGAITGATLLGIAGLHAYWGLGGTWPGDDLASLERKVLSSKTQPFPSPAACFAVAGALTITTAAYALSGRPGPLQAVSQRTSQLAAAALLARGFLGFVLPQFTQANPEFRTLNKKIYSPLCLGLGAALLTTTGPVDQSREP